MRSKVATYLRANKYDLICLGLIFLAGLIPLIWLRKGMLVAYGDSGLFLYNSGRRFYESRFAWSSSSTGGPIGFGISTVPLQFLMALLENVGFSLVLKQKLLFCSLLILSGFGMYFLMLTLLGAKKSRPAALASSMFYMFNFFSMTWEWNLLHLSLFLLPLMPVALTLYVKGLTSGKLSLALSVNLTLLAFAAVLTNPAFVVPFIFFLLVFFLFYVILHKKQKREMLRSLKFSALTILLGILLNLWWILPGAQSVPSVKEAVDLAAERIFSSEQFFQEQTAESPLLYVFRLSTRGALFLHLFSKFYFSPVVLLISFSIPILVFASMLYRRKERVVLFFVLSSLVYLFFSKGAQPPLGGIFYWLFENIPGFQMFRSYITKFGPVLMLSYAVLFGMAIARLKNILEKWCPKLMTHLVLFVVLVTILGVYVFPMWTGEVLAYGSSSRSFSPYVEVPPEYEEARSWLSEATDDFRLVSFPMTHGYHIAYTWAHGYRGSNPGSILLGKPTVNQRSGILSNEINYILPSLLPDESDGFLKVLSLLSAKYLLVSNDVDYKGVGWESSSPQEIREALEHKKGIFLERTFGKLDFYRIDNRYLLPHFYVPEDIIYAQGDTESIVPIVSFEDYKIKSAIFFQSANQSSREFILGKADHIFLTKHKLALVDALKRVGEQSLVPQEGSYEVFVYDDTRIEGLGKSLRIEVDGVQQQVTLPNGGAGSRNWIALGTIRLTPGSHSLRITSQGLLINDVKINNNLVLHLERKQNKADPPEIYFRKINPTRYVVEVKGAASPYLLVFSESFNPAWRAYIVDKETGRRERIPDERHFWVNGYANSWWVDKLGDYEIQVEFWPQRLVYWGAVVSAVTLIASVLYCFIDARRRRRHIS